MSVTGMSCGAVPSIEQPTSSDSCVQRDYWKEQSQQYDTFAKNYKEDVEKMLMQLQVKAVDEAIEKIASLRDTISRKGSPVVPSNSTSQELQQILEMLEVQTTAQAIDRISAEKQAVRQSVANIYTSIVRALNSQSLSMAFDKVKNLGMNQFDNEDTLRSLNRMINDTIFELKRRTIDVTASLEYANEQLLVLQNLIRDKKNNVSEQQILNRIPNEAATPPAGVIGACQDVIQAVTNYQIK